MQRLATLALLALASCQTTIADRPTQFGAEVQLYPTGCFLGPRVEVQLGERDAVHARAAVHFLDRGSSGLHDRETGSGYGAGVGWRRWLDSYGGGWNFGARMDFWRLDIPWDNYQPAQRGNSNVTVWVPAVEGGYSWRMEGGGHVDLNLSLGREFNIDTDGADVGEGAILMLGVSLSGGTRGIRRLHEREPAVRRDTVSMLDFGPRR